MRLRRFRVRAYRCIHDSGDITVGDLAAFVGRNESGKTTILQALTLLNRGESISYLDLCDEMAEDLKSEIRIVEGEFELSASETALITEKFPHLPELKKLKIFRTNKKNRTEYDFGNYKVSDEENEEINSWENFKTRVFRFFDALPEHLRPQIDTEIFERPLPAYKELYDRQMEEFTNKLRDIASEERQVVREWNKIYASTENKYENLLRGSSDKQTLENFIEANLHPRFVYFSDYKKIYGNTDLNEYLREAKDDRMAAMDYTEDFDRAETVRNLFYLAELNIEEMEKLHNSPPKMIKFLNAASNKLTRRLNPAWKGDPIRVDLRYHPGNIMSVVISDVHRDGTITNTGLLSRRAEGFKWTFSFIVNFAAETQRAELKEAILLLDEPARNLHPTQQMGISNLLKSLAGSNQVLYATHSPYMIFDYTPGNLLVVELDKRRHLSRIFYDYWNADSKTLVPILYGLSMGLVESIVDRTIGVNSRPVIIVETISDSMYLHAFDKLVQDTNISLNPLNIVPAFSKNSVLPLAIFYRNHRYRTFVLMDNSEESKQISARLIANEFSPTQIIFLESDGKAVPSIEDYIVAEDYIHAVNQTYGIKLRDEGFVSLTTEEVTGMPHQGVVSNLEVLWKEHREAGWGEFDSEEIARYICEKIAQEETDFISDRTRESFRSLYRLITEKIAQYQNAAPKTEKSTFAGYGHDSFPAGV